MTDKTDTREIVLDILLAVTRDGEYSHIALKNTLDKYQYLEKRERAFLTKVVEGTLEYQIRIDYIINTFSNTIFTAAHKFNLAWVKSGFSFPLTLHAL